MAFTLYSFALGFSVPLLLIAAFYACVIRKLRSAASNQTLGTTRRSRGRENTNRRIEHLVIGIICTYTICWLPYWITQLCVSLLIVDERAPIQGFYQFFLLASCLSYTNSALNPILYAFLSDNFKRRFSDVLRSIYGLRLIGRRSSRRTSNQLGSTTNHKSHHNHLEQHLYQSAATTGMALDTDVDTFLGPTDAADEGSQRMQLRTELDPLPIRESSKYLAVPSADNKLVRSLQLPLDSGSIDSQ